MLSQIVERQKKLQELYAAKIVKPKSVKPKIVKPEQGVTALETVTPIILPPAPEPIIETELPKEKTIAITLPISLHEHANIIMQKTGFTGSKREFFCAVVQSAFEVLDPKQ